MLRKSLPKLCNLAKSYGNGLYRSYSVYEPNYLELLKPKYPIYGLLNIQIKGYDFPVLESYQRYLTSVAKAMDLDVSNGWAVPAETFQVLRYKPQSALTESEYKLTVYERNIQIVDIMAPVYPVLLRLAQASLPEGVSITVVEHTKEQDELRYVPDGNLNELKQQLDEMGGPVQKKKRK
ncbi:39S ribosomal protein L48, mitochondrial [Bradysia coprophila]|uniref:39S ribosomal protein L48, mitochondrial n=1 Tax=Bradysia coprophila TaxID=38358 RepID=UPI00187DAD02|nr:39S ribosomal protein L48, mitochondrial [Bradysia coprophila]